MNLLSIDTSTRWAGVGLQVESGETTQMVWRSDQNHGRELMPAIAELLSRAGLEPGDLTHFAVALGPGGFSAVRVGISTVLGMTIPKDLPIVGVSTHLVESFPFLPDASVTSPVVSLIPAGRGAFSWARFESPDHKPSEMGLASLPELIEMLGDATCVCGEGAESLVNHLSDEQILVNEPPTRSPAALLEIAAARITASELTPASKLRPIYARPPSITLRNQS